MLKKTLIIDIILVLILSSILLVYEGHFFRDYCYNYYKYNLWLSDGVGIFYGAQIVLDGGKIGKDYETFWGPWPHYYHALFLKIFGNKLTSLKLATIVFDIIFTIILYCLFRQFSSPTLAFIFALSMSLFSQRSNYWNHGYTSFYTLSLGWLAFLLFIIYQRKRTYWLLPIIGLIAGITFGFKFSFSLYIIFGVATLLYVKLILDSETLPERKISTIIKNISLSPYHVLRIIFLVGMITASILAMRIGMLPIFALPLLLTAIMLFVLSGYRQSPNSSILCFFKEISFYASGVLFSVAMLYLYYALSTGPEVALKLINPIQKAIPAREVTSQFADVPHSIYELIFNTKGQLIFNPIVLIVTLMFPFLAVLIMQLIQRGLNEERGRRYLQNFKAELLILIMFGLTIFVINSRNAFFLLPPSSFKSIFSPVAMYYLQPLTWIIFWLFPFWVIWQIYKGSERISNSRLNIFIGVFGIFLLLCNFPGVNLCISMWGSFIGISIVILFTFVKKVKTSKRLSLLSLFPIATFIFFIWLFGYSEYDLVRTQIYMKSYGKAILLDSDYLDVYTEQQFAIKMQELKNYVQQNVRPDEEIFSASAFPFIYVLTDRHNKLPQKVLWEGENSEEKQKRVIEYLDHNPVKMVVFYIDSLEAGFGNIKALQIDYPLVYNYIIDGYKYDRTFDKFAIYTKKS